MQVYLRSPESLVSCGPIYGINIGLLMANRLAAIDQNRTNPYKAKCIRPKTLFHRHHNHLLHHHRRHRRHRGTRSLTPVIHCVANPVLSGGG